jgi:hypothetical protein
LASFSLSIPLSKCVQGPQISAHLTLPSNYSTVYKLLPLQQLRAISAGTRVPLRCPVMWLFMKFYLLSASLYCGTPRPCNLSHTSPALIPESPSLPRSPAS